MQHIDQIRFDLDFSPPLHSKNIRFFPLTVGFIKMSFLIIKLFPHAPSLLFPVFLSQFETFSSQIGAACNEIRFAENCQNTTVIF